MPNTSGSSMSDSSLMYFFVVVQGALGWGAVLAAAAELVFLTDDLGCDVLDEHIHQRAAVLGVRHTPAVVDLADDVLE